MLTELEFINASAGSGKTTKLVEKINSLLLVYKASELVAITFTESAARKIKEKVLQKFTETEREDEVSKISISTMHSFFSRIIRENAILLNINPNYSILDPSQSFFLINQIFEEVYLNFLEEEYKFLFSIYTFENIKNIIFKLNSKYYLIYNKLKSYEEYLEEENVYLLKYFEKSLNDFINNLKNIARVSETEIKENFTNEVGRIYLALKDFEISIKTALNEKNTKNIEQILKDILSLNIEINNRYRASNNLKKENEDLALNLKKSLKNISIFIKELEDDLELFKNSFIEGSASILSLFVNLFESFRNKYQNNKKAINAFDFDDLEIMAYGLVKQNKNVAQHYKTKFKFILVDEFQDTNHLQKEIIFSISKNIFIVGDAKQSIFGFRNADLRVFNGVYNEYKEFSISSNENYRSSKNIIEFVNQVSNVMFNSVVNEEEHSIKYEDMIATKKELGHVEIIDVSSEGRDHLKAELESIKNIILKNIENSTYDDFFILLKNNKYIPVISRFLSENKIPNIVIGEANYYEIFRLVYGVIQGLLNPFNNYYLMELTRLPKFYLSESFLYEHRDTFFYEQIINISDFEFIDQNDKNSIFNLKKLFFNFKSKNFKNICDTLNFIFNQTGLLDAVNKFYALTDFDLKFILLDLAIKNNNKSIYEFLEILKTYKPKDDLNLPKNNKVKILTIHKSKGLDKKIVILPMLHLGKSHNDQIVISSNGDISIKLPINYKPDWKKSSKYKLILEEENKKKFLSQ